MRALSCFAVVLALIVTPILTACGGGDHVTASDRVRIEGDSNLDALAAELAAKWKKDHPNAERVIFKREGRHLVIIYEVPVR